MKTKPKNPFGIPDAVLPNGTMLVFKTTTRPPSGIPNKQLEHYKEIFELQRRENEQKQHLTQAVTFDILP